MAGNDCVCGGSLCVMYDNFADSTACKYKCNRCGKIYEN